MGSVLPLPEAWRLWLAVAPVLLLLGVVLAVLCGALATGAGPGGDAQGLVELVAQLIIGLSSSATCSNACTFTSTAPTDTMHIPMLYEVQCPRRSPPALRCNEENWAVQSMCVLQLFTHFLGCLQ